MDELEKVLDDLWMTGVRFCERPSSELPMRLPGNLEQKSHGGLEYIAEAKRRINATRACEIAETVRPWREFAEWCSKLKANGDHSIDICIPGMVADRARALLDKEGR